MLENQNRQKEKVPKLTFKTSEKVRKALKMYVIDQGTTLDKFLHSLTESHLESQGLLKPTSVQTGEGV